MTQYHHLDESGDPGTSGAPGSSSHFALALVQLAERAPLAEITAARREIHFAGFEFKYHNASVRQKAIFFHAVREIQFRVRAVVAAKSQMAEPLRALDGQALTLKLLADLIMRAPALDIANDILVLDGAVPAFRKALRVRLTAECQMTGRVRPFKKIVSGDSRREDGLQLADMVVGAVRQHVMGVESDYFQTFANKVVDLWQVPE